MELRISEIQLPEQITFNYDELKQELTEKVSMYEALVYTEEQIKEAKADKAKLNKLKKALNDERIRREKEYMQPFNDFKAKINEIISIIDKPVALIDTQLKEYEEKRKQEKAVKVDEILKEAEKSLPDDMHIPFDSKWLNSSVSMKSIKETIDARIEQVKNDLDTLSNLPEFGFEAVEVYKTTLDINKAVNEAKRMSEIAKAKAEAERKRIEAEQKRAEMEEAMQNTVAPTPNEVEEVVPAEPKRDWISFKALLSVDEAKDLKWFLETKGIKFEAI